MTTEPVASQSMDTQQTLRNEKFMREHKMRLCRASRRSPDHRLMKLSNEQNL